MQQEKIKKIKKKPTKHLPEYNYQSIFNKILKGRGGRLTEERKILLKTICNMKGHFEAEAILKNLNKSGHNISLATIYRNISLLLDGGIIRRASLVHGDPSRMQFECIFEQQHHDDLICTVCKKRVEFNYPAIEILQEAVAKDYGFVLTGHNLELLGICPACQKNGGDKKYAHSTVNIDDDDYYYDDVKPVLPLSDIKKGVIAKIVHLSGEKNIISRLNDFGLHKDLCIILLRMAPMGGPLLIEITNSKSKVMINRKLAEHVLIQEVTNGAKQKRL
ncbi:MAG: transcriptional repressor [Oligoflexia bacterium]|nr:transcriptional repressor [Oligoflexia bacterium]